MDIIFSCSDTITLITEAKTLIIANPGCFPWTSQAHNYSPNRKCPSDSPPPESSWVSDSPPFFSVQPQLHESVLQWVPKTRLSAPPGHAPQRMSLEQSNNLPVGASYPLSRHPISLFQGVAPWHFRGWSLIMWMVGGGGILFSSMKRGEQKTFQVCDFPIQLNITPPHPVINDQSIILVNFECFVLLSP